MKRLVLLMALVVAALTVGNVATAEAYNCSYSYQPMTQTDDGNPNVYLRHEILNWQGKQFGCASNVVSQHVVVEIQGYDGANWTYGVSGRDWHVPTKADTTYFGSCQFAAGYRTPTLFYYRQVWYFGNTTSDGVGHLVVSTSPTYGFGLDPQYACSS